MPIALLDLLKVRYRGTDLSNPISRYYLFVDRLNLKNYQNSCYPYSLMALRSLSKFDNKCVPPFLGISTCPTPFINVRSQRTHVFLFINQDSRGVRGLDNAKLKKNHLLSEGVGRSKF